MSLGPLVPKFGTKRQGLKYKVIKALRGEFLGSPLQETSAGPGLSGASMMLPFLLIFTWFYTLTSFKPPKCQWAMACMYFLLLNSLSEHFNCAGVTVLQS